MLIVQQKKINIHIFFILQKQINLIFENLVLIIKNNYLSLLSFLCFIFVSKNLTLKNILFNFDCVIKNTDLDLFKRELICLILI
jgi:hypothetical protein